MPQLISKEKFEKTIDFLVSEIKQLRTGRAHPSLVENILVQAYNTKTPLLQLAGISIPEPRQILIQPWDKGLIKNIERAIAASNLDLTAQVDSHNLIRINIPALNEERRQNLIKLVNQKIEEAKVAIRNEREDHIKKWRAMEKNGEISEDDFFASQKEIQNIVDKYNEKIKELGEKKQQEILTI